MAQTKLNMLLQVRRDNIFTSTYVLQKGEPGFEISTNTLKIGDGVKTWAELPVPNRGLDDSYKTIQEAIAKVETDANVFIDTIAQNENGEIAITTKAVDFSAADSRFKKLQTAIEAVATAKNVFVEQIAQDAQGVITITTKAVDFSDYRTSADQDVIDAAQDAKIKAIADDYVTDTAYQAHLTAQAEVDEAQDEKIEALEHMTQYMSVKTDEDKTTFTTPNTTVDIARSEFNVSTKNITFSTYGTFTLNEKAVAIIDDVNDAKAAVIGTDADTANSATIVGAKKYTDAVKAEVIEMIDGVASAGLTRSIVTELPDASEAALNTIYMIKRTAGLDAKDIYDEYIVIEVEGVKHFELLGNTELDLSNYYTKTESENLFVENNEYVEYKNAHANDYTNTQIDNAISTAISAEENRAEGAYSKIGHKHVVADITDYATDVANKIEAYGYATTNEVATAKQEAIDAAAGDATTKANKALEDAKAYTDEKIGALPIHREGTEGGSDYTYINALDGLHITSSGDFGFDLDHTQANISTPNDIGLTVDGAKVATQAYVDAQITEKAGVTKVVAGNDIVVTPAEGIGEVTVSHETFTTGEYTKDPASSDKTGDIYMMTSVTVDNGHVTGAAVKSLAAALEGMTFIFDGGTSTT